MITVIPVICNSVMSGYVTILYTYTVNNVEKNIGYMLVCLFNKAYV